MNDSRRKTCIWILLLLLTASSVLVTGCGRIDGLVDLERDGEAVHLCPVVVLKDAGVSEFSVERFLEQGIKSRIIYGELALTVDSGGEEFELEPVIGKDFVYRCEGLDNTCGWADLVIRDNDVELERYQKVIRVIDKFRVTLTFDDGPAVDKKSVAGDFSKSPTVIVLNGLDEFVHGEGGCNKGIKAAFFVLTTSDRFFKLVFSKAETDAGKAVLREVAKRGHVIGAHAGGEYGSQFNSHDKRVLEPGYSVSGRSGAEFENALESDLFECVNTIEEVTGIRPCFVRPPLWRYKSEGNTEVGGLVKQAYDRLGLKMILTDARFPDGGYYIISIIAVQKYRAFRKNLQRAFLSGEDNLIISMHDSNGYTANIIGNMLGMIGEEFEKIDFSGVSGSAGRRLDFADSYDEVADNLSEKRRYVMFPEYNKSGAE